MKSDTISENGWSFKIHNSKGIFSRELLFVAVIICAILSSCVQAVGHADNDVKP